MAPRHITKVHVVATSAAAACLLLFLLVAGNHRGSAKCPARDGKSALGSDGCLASSSQESRGPTPQPHLQAVDRDLSGRCPARPGPSATPGNLHIFTLSVESKTGQSVVSLFEQTACPGGTNQSTCPVQNLGNIIANPMAAHPELFPHGFMVVGKPVWLTAALSGLPDDDLVIFLDGGDVVYGGCGNHHPEGLVYVARDRLQKLLARANASVVFGAELNRYDMPSDLKVPEWAKARCPDLTSADGSGDWIYDKTDCARPSRLRQGRSSNQYCTPSEEGAVSSMSNVNTGLVAGYVCEVRAAAWAVASEAGSAPSTKLRGFTDQGKYWSYYMDDVNMWPAAAGNPSEVTLDYCADLVLNLYRGVNSLPLKFDPSARSVSLVHHGPIGAAYQEPLCFFHFAGDSHRSKLFEAVTELNGVRCRKTNRGGYKTGICRAVPGREDETRRGLGWGLGGGWDGSSHKAVTPR